MRLSFVLATVLACTVALAHAQTTPSSQVLALQDIYTSLGGAYWTKNTNWLVGDPCKVSWYGVSCTKVNSTNYNVLSIFLPKNNLKGQLPNTLNEFPGLTILNLSGNSINGAIPSTVYSIPVLQTLDLSHNQLTGGIFQSQPINAGSMIFFNVSLNQLSGALPSFTGFSSLQSLDIHSNKFTGSISSSYSYLSALTTFDLSNNQLSGSITSYFPSGLSYFNVSHNSFGSSLPSFSNFNSLRVFDISHNKFNGYFPSGVNALPSLKVLDVSYNQLYGTVPSFASSGYGSWPLTTLDLSHNSFSSYLPSVTAPNLEILNFSNNDFGGYLTYSYSSFSSLKYFDISNNQIGGSFSTTFYSSYSLSYLNISHNAFTSSLPYVYNYNNLEVFDASNNQFSDYIPSSLGSKIRIFDIANNYISGSFPSTYFYSSTLEHLNMSHNQLDYELPWSYSTPSKLTVLDLSHNYLTGEIPSFLDVFPLKVLYLNNNQFSGPLPSFLQTEQYDLDFNATNNRFDCPLPSWCDANKGNGLCAPCYSQTNWWLIGGITFGVGFLIVTLIVASVAFVIHRRKKNAESQGLLDYNAITQDAAYIPSYIPSDGGSFNGGAYTPVYVAQDSGTFNNGGYAPVYIAQDSTFNNQGYVQPAWEKKWRIEGLKEVKNIKEMVEMIELVNINSTLVGEMTGAEVKNRWKIARISRVVEMRHK